METKYIVYSREKFEYNTDPLRRCYNGCHFKSEWRWSQWNQLSGRLSKEDAEASVRGWYTIGRKTCEYKAFPEGVDPNASQE